MNATKTVEVTCQLIEKYKLMSSKDYAAMRARWFRPGRQDVDDPEAFRKWLVFNRYLTGFVAKVLAGRKSDQLVLNQYRLQDQMISGPMAGAYLALDALDRQVAIEVLSSKSVKDSAVLMGFQKVAAKAMEVDHPNVSRIVDTGEAHGLHYLVKEFSEGPTLDDILKQRGKISYLYATRLMALALAGLDALHTKGVPAGDLTAECLLLAPVGKGAPNQRTVKILHAGVKRQLFDETAIGRSIVASMQLNLDDLELAQSTTFTISAEASANPPEDIFRLGCIFYRCVTGKAPFAEADMPRPSRPARPVAELAPEVPEMLCGIIEQMIEPDPTKRQQKAAHVAKALRVFLAAEEQAREVKVEEHIVAPTDKTAATAAYEEPDVEEDGDGGDEEAPPRRHTPQEGIWGKAVALWDELQPSVRDLLFIAGGALGMLAVIFLVELVTGIRLVYIAGLVTGMVASYCVDLYLKWRRRRQDAQEAAATS
jgi:serine/threonine-protein kinase